MGGPARRGRHFSSPRFRCWSDCRMRTSISTSASSWSCCRSWSRAGPSPRRRGGWAYRFRAAIPLPRRVELDLPGQLEQEIVGYRQSQQSVPQARPAAVLGAPDAGGARAENPQSDRGPSGAAGRLRLPAGAAGEGAGARPFLRQHAAAGGARPAPARRLLRVGRGDARRARRHLRPVDRAGRGRRYRSPTISPRRSSGGRSRATSCRSDPLRFWLIASTKAASPASACGCRKTTRSRRDVPAKLKKARARFVGAVGLG